MGYRRRACQTLHHCKSEVWLKESWVLETTSVTSGSVTVDLPVTLIGCGIHGGVYPLRPKAKIIPSSTELLPVQYLAIGMREVILAGL